MSIQNNKNLNEIKSEVFVNELEIDNAKSKSSGSEDIESLFRKIFERMDKTISDINSVVESIFSNLERALDRKLTFDEFIQIMSMTLDERILATQNEQRIKYISGIIVFTVNKIRKVLEYKADCYYQDALKSWIKQEHKGYIKLSNFDKSAESQLKEILDKGEMKLEIEPPEQN